MKKTYLILLFSLFIQEAHVLAREEIKTPRIILEEMEITLLREGKAVKQMRLPKGEGARIVKEVEETVLEEMGLSSLKDLRKSGQAERFNREMSRRVERNFIDPAVLSFLDAKGTAIKRMVLKRPGREAHAGEAGWREAVASAGIRAPTSRDAVISGDGRYALVTEYFAGTPRRGAPVRTGEASQKLHITSSHLRLYDAEGRMLFEEETPDNTYVNKMALSSDGKIAAYIEVTEGRGEKEKASKNRLCVIDREKTLLLQFPGEKDDAYRTSSRFLVLSPGGRYLSFSARKEGKIVVNLFFDLNKGSRWEASEEFTPAAIDDEGNVHIKGRKGINIKKHLGR